MTQQISFQHGPISGLDGLGGVDGFWDTFTNAFSTAWEGVTSAFGSDDDRRLRQQHLPPRVGAHVAPGMRGLGDDLPDMMMTDPLFARSQPTPLESRISFAAYAWGALALASAVLSGYHGYRRNKSVGWGVGWFALGSVFPIITPTIAFAQGFAKPKR